jgi:glutamate decarboxylase
VDQQATIVQRIIVRHGLSIDMADLILLDVENAIEKLDSRPPTRPLGASEGAAFNHNARPVVAASRISS